MDIKLYYEEYGDGFPLILLHGNGEDCTYFKNQIAVFSEKYRVIAIDTRGHGKSPRGTAEFNLDVFADDLKETLDLMNIKKCNLLGFSDGGNIALIFSLKYPGYVDHLILNGADLDPGGVKLSVQLPIILGWAFVKILSLFNKAAVQKFEMLNLMVTQPHIDHKELKRLSMPVLVLAGTKDMIKDKHSRLIASSIPGSKLEIINGSHFIARESPDEFNSSVMNFLSSGKAE